MKLIVRQISGLGNQMFQYAAGRYYARKYHADMQMATDPPEKATSHGHPRPFLLSNFAIGAPCEQLNMRDSLLLRGAHPRLRPAAGALMQAWLRTQIVTEEIEQMFRFQPVLPIRSNSQVVYLVGYWQVHNIADALEAELRQEFSLRNAPTGRNAEVLGLIESAPSPVSLHIRRGDYTLEVEGNVALQMEYYTHAVLKIKEAVQSPTFFVFSDDMAFAKANLSLGSSTVFVDHNDSFAAHEDLRLMSSCRHHIIANSTFSWWGAWLNSSPQKRVIAPRKWMVAQSSTYDDLFPTSWQLL